jgi:CheY-like chemotaxis protein
VRLPQAKIGPERLGKEIVDNLHNFRTSSSVRMRRAQITRDPMPYGKVLIVDDVETNIFVARGLLRPYDLEIDSADSGISAIEKINSGKTYDVVFMDHMMPDMDGIEATKILRDTGYREPIVALTANAVAGQAEMFLSNGFDDYISKPIDIRRLNLVLNRLIRDKQPPEVIEEARKQAGMADSAFSGTVSYVPGNPLIIESFLRDAKKALEALKLVMEEDIPFSDKSMRNYIIYTHGMKSALLNVGQGDLSAIASSLEHAGRNNDFNVIKTETPDFLTELRIYVECMTMCGETGGTPVAGDENIDTAHIKEKLLAIKAACEDYDAKAAKNILKELREAPQPQQVSELLNAIAEKLLHSDFEEITGEIDSFVEMG